MIITNSGSWNNCYIFPETNSRGIFTNIYEPEANNCFGIITQVIIEIPKQRNVTIWPQFAIVDKVHTTLLASMCHAMPFWTRALKKNHFLWRSNRIKNKSKCGFVVCTLIDNGSALLLFSYCFCMLSEFAKVFERKSDAYKYTAHMHNAARALSSRSRCFQLSTNLNKDFFRYL